ncbi:MAG: ankyrin repeat domain-containing protein, partial [Burkholderiales bacterium]
LAHGARQFADTKGVNPVHFAAAKGATNLIQILSRFSYADLEATNVNGYTPLHFAALHNQLKVVQQIIQDNYRLVNIKTNKSRESKHGVDKQTPLHLAARAGNFRMVNELINHGADYSAKDEHQTGLLAYVAQSGNKQLMEFFADTVLFEDDSQLAEAFVFAAMRDYLGIINFLLSQNIPVNMMLRDTGQTAIHTAAANGADRALVKLLNCGASPNPFARFGIEAPLLSAVKGGHLNATQLLLNSGAEDNLIDQSGNNLLHLSVVNNHPALLAYLLLHGLDTSKENYSGLT